MSTPKKKDNNNNKFKSNNKSKNKSNQKTNQPKQTPVESKAFDTSDPSFLQTMEQLVSNDKTIRENAAQIAKKYLHESYSNDLELYQKISKSLFYFYWNTDKSAYQVAMAKLISSFIYINEEDKTKLIPKYKLWISTFLSEISKKFQSIDVLRLDKYIMMCDHVMSTYLSACLENKLYKSIIYLIKYFINEIENSNNFNFTFESNKIKVISRFLKLLLEEDKKDIQYKDDYLNNEESGFIIFYKNLLLFYKEIKDKRETKLFSEDIFDVLINGLIKNKKENNKNENLINKIKEESESFLKENKELLNGPKILGTEYFINKLKDENFQKPIKEKTNIVDPVNDYIMKKNYMAKFKKSKEELKKERLLEKEKKKQLKSEKKENENIENKQKEKEEKSIEKEEKKEKQKSSEKKDKKEKLNKLENISKELDFDNMTVEKELINLNEEDEDEDEKEKEKENKKDNKNNIKEKKIENKKDKDKNKDKNEKIEKKEKKEINKDNKKENLKEKEKEKKEENKEEPKTKENKIKDKDNKNKDKDKVKEIKNKEKNSSDDESLVEDSDEDEELLSENDNDDDDDDDSEDNNNNNIINTNKTDINKKIKEKNKMKIEEEEDGEELEEDDDDDEDFDNNIDDFEEDEKEDKEDEEYEINEEDLEEYGNDFNFMINAYSDKKTLKNTKINMKQGLLNKKTKRNFVKNKNNKNKKKKISFSFENNVVSIYNSKVPITLTSKKKNVFVQGPSKMESLLKKK